MKKFLEVLMDDEGLLHLSTDVEFNDEIENPPTNMKEHLLQVDDLNRRTIRSMVTELWKNHNLNVSKAIRFLSMAEIIACAEPYDQTEQFWSAMMFDYIPSYEKMSSALKIPFGFDPSKMIRPITMSSAPMGMPFTPFGFGKVKN